MKKKSDLRSKQFNVACLGINQEHGNNVIVDNIFCVLLNYIILVSVLSYYGVLTTLVKYLRSHVTPHSQASVSCSKNGRTLKGQGLHLI